MSKLLGNRLAMVLRAPAGSAGVHGTSRIGTREVVGYGINGSANYADRSDFPMPAVRFREDTPDIKVLREKEKGPWKNLSLEEKKVLYRASFCQTFAEFEAPTGEWKMVLGYSLMLISTSLWLMMAMKKFVFPPQSITLDEEHQKAQLKRMLDLEVNPITGLSSKWDYENKRWK